VTKLLLKVITKILNDFGIYWNEILLTGKYQNLTCWAFNKSASNRCNFKDQIGIYLLHDSERKFLLDRIEQPLGKRLKDIRLTDLRGVGIDLVVLDIASN
jgi:hypothetical protein